MVTVKVILILSTWLLAFGLFHWGRGEIGQPRSQPSYAILAVSALMFMLPFFFIPGIDAHS